MNFAGQRPNDAKIYLDCESDAERADFFASGRAYETGIVAASIQHDVARAFYALSLIGDAISWPPHLLSEISRGFPPSPPADGPPSPDSRERPALIGDQVDADIWRLRSLCVGLWAAESESSREMAAWYADCANRYEIIAGAYFATWRREKQELNNG